MNCRRMEASEQASNPAPGAKHITEDETETERGREGEKEAINGPQFFHIYKLQHIPIIDMKRAAERRSGGDMGLRHSHA